MPVRIARGGIKMKVKRTLARLLLALWLVALATPVGALSPGRAVGGVSGAHPTDLGFPPIVN